MAATAALGGKRNAKDGLDARIRTCYRAFHFLSIFGLGSR
jgi:hypothetical protein